MDKKLIIDCKKVLEKYRNRIIQLYSEYALLLNACSIASDRYKNLEYDMILSTTRNIPLEFKKIFDTDITFDKEDLVIEYTSKLLKVLSNNFIGELISIFDACLEELYEEMLKCDKYEENQIENKIRNSWRNDTIIDYFINYFKIKKTKDKFTTPTLAFNLYKELREFRHAIIHNNGVLSNKNKKNLYEIEKSILKECKNESLNIENVLIMSKFFKELQFIRNDVLELNVYAIYFLRSWILDEIDFLDKCISEKGYELIYR